MGAVHVHRAVLAATFAHFRACGRGLHECQVLWVSSWTSPDVITEVVHPKHTARFGGFVLDDRWLSDFWLRLARDNLGIRVQVHTHPKEAFHSSIDDDFPIVHTPGFLSLVIPNFGLGPVDLRDAYLTTIDQEGYWSEVPVYEGFFIK